MNRSLIVRKLHRWIGLFFSAAVFMASGSGILHNVMTWTQQAPPPARPAGPGLDAARIRVSVQDCLAKIPQQGRKIQAVSIREIGGAPWYQFMFEGVQKPVYMNAETGEFSESQDEVYARQIASSYLGGKAAAFGGYLTSYDSEYIAIFRILPVYRFNAGDRKNSRVYVSTMTGSVTRYTDDAKQFEASAFTNFHKWGFIKNKFWRDLVLTTMTSGIFLLSLLGLILFFMTKPRK